MAINQKVGLPALLVLLLDAESGSARNGSNLINSMGRIRPRDLSGDRELEVVGSMISGGIGEDRRTERGSSEADEASTSAGSEFRFLRISNMAGVFSVISPTA